MLVTLLLALWLVLVLGISSALCSLGRHLTDDLTLKSNPSRLTIELRQQHPWPNKSHVLTSSSGQLPPWELTPEMLEAIKTKQRREKVKKSVEQIEAMICMTRSCPSGLP